jgi:hypothetical protein
MPVPSSGPWPAGAAAPLTAAIPSPLAGLDNLDTDPLADGYERLRSVVLGGAPDAHRLGLAVLARQGMAAWMTVWHQTATPATIPAARRSPTAEPGDTIGSADREIVRVLAAMALAHIPA